MFADQDLHREYQSSHRASGDGWLMPVVIVSGVVAYVVVFWAALWVLGLL